MITSLPEAGRSRLGCGLRALILTAALAFAASPGLFAQKAPALDFPYQLELRPERPETGSILEIVVSVKGLDAADLRSEIRLDPSLTVEAQSVRPRLEERTGSRVTEFRAEIRVLKAGRHRIERITLSGKEGKLDIGPLNIDTREARSAADPGTLGPKPLPDGGETEPSIWRWKLPPVVHRFEAFSLRLEKVDAPAAPEGASAVFDPPPGLVFERSSSSSWIAIALDDRKVVTLPEVQLLVAGREVGRAAAETIRVLPLPPELADSRAIGDFKLGLERLPPRNPAGTTLTIRLVLSGSGNFPVVKLPEPSLRLDGKNLPPGALSLKTIENYRPEGSSYRGKIVLEATVGATEAGNLRITVPPFVFMNSGGSIRRLEAPVATVSLLPAADKAGLAAAPAMLLREMDAAATRIAASNGRVMDAELVRIGLKWKQGAPGEALAGLYALLRWTDLLSGRSRDLTRLAAACSGALGAEPPLLDSLGPPRPYFLVAAAASILSLAFYLLLFRFLGGGGKPRRRRIAIVSVFLVIALLSSLMAISALLQRNSAYAVIWTDSLMTVPSRLGQARVPVIRGTTALVKGEASGFIGLRLADGIAGWAPRESVYFY